MLEFTNKDFNSNDGMLTSVWGPVMWHMLHTISFNYPVKPTDEQIKDYYRFFKKLKKILPCGTCRDNLSKNYKSLEFGKHYFKNRETLSKFVYNLHETLNKMLNKKSNLTYEDVRNKYELLRARCIDKNVKSACKKDHKGCSEWLHGIGEDKPCTYIVITSGKDDNKFKKMLKGIKDNKTSFGNEPDACKIVIDNEVYNKCSKNRRKQSGGRKSKNRQSKNNRRQSGGRKSKNRQSKNRQSKNR